MRRIGWLIRRGSRLAAVAGVIGLAVGPEVVCGRVEEILIASWKAAGEALVGRDLAALTSGLAGIRDELQQVQAKRNALARRLGDLETRRQAAGTRAEQGQKLLERITGLLNRLPEGEDRAVLEREADWYSRRNQDASREVAQLDAATSLLADEIDQADHHIQATHDRLQVRESELALLRATSDAQQLRRELAELGDVPPCWNARAGRAIGLLQPLNPRPAIEPPLMAVRHLAALPLSQELDN